MTKDDIQQLRSVLSDLRFMQASALVASKLNESKQAIAYMNNLARLCRVLDDELKAEK